MLVDEGTLTVKELDERIRLIEGAVPEVITSSDLMMIGEVIDHARRIYVHSNLGREMILRHRPLRAEDVHVVPFAMPPPRPRSATASPPVVAAFGHLQYGPVLVDAACLLARRREQVTVRLVGAGVRAGELDQLRDLVASRGLADRVLLLGLIDDENYHRELAGASVAIQLRVYSHGEMSASVIDCLAAGVPTVINEFGALSELPEDVAARVPAHPTVDQIVDAVEVLLDDEHAAARLAGSGQEFVRAHGADRAARGLLELIAGP
jgi:glycosyltransferase involved in cell wall biosynthesis